MVKCFICTFDFADPQELCVHIKSSHQVSGENSYRCTICKSEFTKMWKYQRHLNLCFSKVPDSVVRESVSAIEANHTQRNLLQFESKVNKMALDFICELSSNMNIPRNYVFEIVDKFKSFFSAIILEGHSEFVKPFVSSVEQSNVEYYIQICKDPFRKVKTECRLDSILEKADLVGPLVPIDFAEKDKENGILMPLEFQFKKFFELPNVFQLTQNFANQVSKDTKISHFINSETWKHKIKSFKESDIVIPFHLFIDETQVNNALGSHRAKGLETCTYYSFPTIPPQYSSRLENIFVAQLFSSGATKKFGNFECFGKLIEAINKLAKEQVTLNIDGEEKKVITLPVIVILWFN